VGRKSIPLNYSAATPFDRKRQEQFAQFYSDHYPPAWGYLRRMLIDSDDAYDTLIHSFELALERFEEYLAAPPDVARYWFFGIVRNSASYFLRKRAKDRMRVVPQPRATATPEDIALANEEQELVARALAELPQKYREVAVLRFQNFSYGEIAQVLGLTLAAVESRMRRAIIKLEPFYAEFKAGIRA